MPRVKVDKSAWASYSGYHGLHDAEYWKKLDKRQARTRVEWIYKDLEYIATSFHRAGMEEEAKRTILAIKTLQLLWMRKNDKGKYRLATKITQSPPK